MPSLIGTRKAPALHKPLVGNFDPPVTSGLVLHYDFNNQKSYPGSGTTAFDLSTQGNNGTLTNGPVFGANSSYPYENSLTLDGDNDYINCGNDASLRCSANNAITIACALQFSGFGDTYQRIIDKSSGGAGDNGWALYGGLNASDVLYFGTAAANGMDSGSFLMSNLTAGKWFIFVVGFDGTTAANSYWRINNTNYVANAVTATIPSGTTTCRIGTWSTTAREWNGKFGFMSVWDRLLSADEANRVYNRYKNTYGIS